MQGLPIQNLMKQAVKGEAKATSHNASIKNAGENSEFSAMLGNTSAADAKKVNVDFSELLNGEKSKSNGQKGEEANAELLLGKDSNAAEKSLNIKGENKLAKEVEGTEKGLDQLLGNLKNNSSLQNSKGEEAVADKKNFFPNQKESQLNASKELPLDFLVKTAKSAKNGELENTQGNSELLGQMKEDKKSFFPNQVKIPNNLTQNSAEEARTQTAKDSFKLVSGEEFADIKKFDQTMKMTDKKSVVPEKMLDQDNVIDLSKLKGNQTQVKGYQQGQNILSDNIIKSSRDLAFKEQKKGKLSATDELTSPDLKKSNELSMIKESIIPMSAMKIEGEKQMAGTNTPKVLDLSHVNTANTNQLIQKISDYVMQSNVAGKDQLDLTVKHEQLGQFQIQVTKNQTPNQPHQIDMQIVTSNAEGHKFFVENEGALMKSLQQSGIQLSDLRIVSQMSEIGTNSFSENKQFSSFNHNQNGSSSSQQFESQTFQQQGDFRQGRERRNDLWNEYRERYGA